MEFFKILCFSHYCSFLHHSSFPFSSTQHSCSPNLFSQTVFVDTHDLRFPWLSFFAAYDIKAGTELTWDYNYAIGSIEGRQIECKCGAPECRKRLL